MIYLPFVGVVPNGRGPVSFCLIGEIVVVSGTVPRPLTAFTCKSINFNPGGRIVVMHCKTIAHSIRVSGPKRWEMDVNLSDSPI